MHRLRRGADGDEGFAILVVLGGMLALTLVLVATASYLAASLPVSKRGQDAAAAVQAAQAGVDDYLGRLATCDSYWNSFASCRTTRVNQALTPDAVAGAGNGVTGSDPSPAATGWATIPGSSANLVAQYHVDEVVTPASGSSVIRVKVTGRVKPLATDAAVVKRSLVVDLGKASLLQYIYYTDKEASDPAGIVTRYPPRTESLDPSTNSGFTSIAYAGVSPTEAAKCGRYWYGATATALRRNEFPTETWTKSSKSKSQTGSQSYGCDIQFAPADVIDGKLHTNDAVLLDNPLFKGEATSAWPAVSTPAPPASAWYRLTSSGTAPQAAGFAPKYGPPVVLPNSNTQIKDRTDPTKGGQNGCPYTGPTRIVLKGNGTMDVTSPLTTQTNAGCTTGTPGAPGLSVMQNVPLPQNGVIYVEKSTAACTGKPTAFPLPAADLTPYDCTAGDVFLEGVLKGQLTVATRNDVVVTGNVTYQGGSTGGDVLGLVSEGDVDIYHPVRCATTPPSGFACSSFVNIDVGLTDITVSAAILSVQHSFTVQNFDRGAKLGKLTVLGGIYQQYRGAVGTGGATGSGYAKNYSYDAKLKALPPPAFLNPAAAPWVNLSSAELAPSLPCPTSGTLPVGCLPA